MTSGDRWRKLLHQNFSDTADYMTRFRDETLDMVERAALTIIERIEQGGKLMIMGNGGSAAQAQHMAAELVNRFLSKHRRPLPAISLTTDTSILTSTANDIAFSEVFSVQVQALAAPGDVILAISTSGNSANINNALEIARERGVYRIGLTGRNGGRQAALVDLEIRVDGDQTPQIQEVHIAVIHNLCHILDLHFEENGE